MPEAALDKTDHPRQFRFLNSTPIKHLATTDRPPFSLGTWGHCSQVILEKLSVYVLSYRVSLIKVPTLVFGNFRLQRHIYGMNILVLTIHMTGIVKLGRIQAFIAHWERKIKQMATLFNIGFRISKFSMNLMDVCTNQNLMSLIHSCTCNAWNDWKCIHVALIYDSTASLVNLLSEIITI